MKRQVKYVPLEGFGLRSQGNFQVANIINSDWMDEVFQLLYFHIKLIRCVCVCLSVDTAQHTCGLVCSQNSWTQQRNGTEQETCSHLPNYYHALCNNIKKDLTLQYETSPDCLVTWNTYFLTHYMKQSPSSEANRFAASHEILRVLWNPKVHYGINNLTSPVIRSHLNLGLPSGLFSLGFANSNLYTTLLKDTTTLIMQIPIKKCNNSVYQWYFLQSLTNFHVQVECGNIFSLSTCKVIAYLTFSDCVRNVSHITYLTFSANLHSLWECKLGQRLWEEMLLKWRQRNC